MKLNLFGSMYDQMNRVEAKLDRIEAKLDQITKDLSRLSHIEEVVGDMLALATAPKPPPDTSYLQPPAPPPSASAVPPMPRNRKK